MRRLLLLFVFRNVSGRCLGKIELSSRCHSALYWRLALYGRERFRRSGLRCLWSRPMLTPCRRRTEMFCSTRLANMPTNHQRDIWLKETFPGKLFTFNFSLNTKDNVYIAEHSCCYFMNIWKFSTIFFTFLCQHWYEGADELIVVMSPPLVIDLRKDKYHHYKLSGNHISLFTGWLKGNIKHLPCTFSFSPLLLSDTLRSWWCLLPRTSTRPASPV